MKLKHWFWCQFYSSRGILLLPQLTVHEDLINWSLIKFERSAKIFPNGKLEINQAMLSVLIEGKKVNQKPKQTWAIKIKEPRKILNKPNVKCWNFGEKGHFRTDCTKLKKNKLTNLKLTMILYIQQKILRFSNS